MLLAGDAVGHTQYGNNNGYCQDNESSWVHWNLKQEDEELLAFTQSLLALRKSHPIFRRRRFFQGRCIKGTGIKDIIWLNPDGLEMSDEEWQRSFARCLGLLLSGEALDDQDERGRPLRDDNFLLLLNAHFEMIDFVVPSFVAGSRWRTLFDTHYGMELKPDRVFAAGDNYPLQARSMVLLQEIKEAKQGQAGRIGG